MTEKSSQEVLCTYRKENYFLVISVSLDGAFLGDGHFLCSCKNSGNDPIRIQYNLYSMKLDREWRTVLSVKAITRVRMPEG